MQKDEIDLAVFSLQSDGNRRGDNPAWFKTFHEINQSSFFGVNEGRRVEVGRKDLCHEVIVLHAFLVARGNLLGFWRHTSAILWRLMQCKWGVRTC